MNKYSEASQSQLNTQLPSPAQLHEQFPLTPEQKLFILRTREDLCRILDGIDKRLILILGPCSVHNMDATLKYAEKLKSLAQDISEHFLILMRAHYEKPRTRTGWKGLLYDPHLDGTDDIHTGLQWTRRLLIELTSMQIPISTEFLDPLLTPYFSDLICWGQIGARTSESQIHRQMASGLSMPVGFKNRTDGCVKVAVNAVMAAYQPQSYLGLDHRHQVHHIQTTGNPYCHVVLRGGQRSPNWDLCSISETAEELRKAGLSPRMLIDCAHDNCRKSPSLQAEIFRQVLDTVKKQPQLVSGIMLESYLDKGNQVHHPDPKLIEPTVSITDPCMGWSCTEKLIMEACESIPSRTPALTAIPSVNEKLN